MNVRSTLTWGVGGVAALIAGGMAGADSLEVPGQYATIQAAIDAAFRGDEVIVAPGTYLESINFNAKAITVTSLGGPGVTTIDAQGTDRVVHCTNGEGPDTILAGFTITGGLDHSNGGGMRIDNGSPQRTR